MTKAPTLFTQLQGWEFLLVYLASMLVLTYFYARGYNKTKDSYLVANRGITSWWNALSIAATWVWAPALFVSAQKTFEEGWIGFLYFSVPNALSLVLFGYFAKKLRDRSPDGYTLSGYARERFKTRRVQGAYLTELLALSVCSFAVNLLGGGLIISTLMGIPFWQVTIALSVIAFSYTYWSGFKASVATDYFQTLIIFAVGLILIPWVVIKAGGLETLKAGLHGVRGATNPFSGAGAMVFWAWGFSAFVGYWAGPMADQTFYQRAWGAKKEDIMSAFSKAALIFWLIPFMMSFLGYVAAGTASLQSAKGQTINLTTIIHFLPAWTTIPFSFMILCGLVSTLDSMLTGVSCFAGHDFCRKGKTGSDVVSESRWGMIALIIGGILLANVPGIKIVYLWLFFSTLRLTVFMPTIIALLTRDNQIHEAGVFWGIVLSGCFGLPIFAYGNFFVDGPDKWMWMVGGTMSVFILSAVVTLLVSKLKGTLGLPMVAAEVEIGKD